MHKSTMRIKKLKKKNLKKLTLIQPD